MQQVDESQIHKATTLQPDWTCKEQPYTFDEHLTKNPPKESSEHKSQNKGQTDKT